MRIRQSGCSKDQYGAAAMKLSLYPMALTITRWIGLSIGSILFTVPQIVFAAEDHVSTIEVIEYDDVIEDIPDAPDAASAAGLAQFGPFSVVDAQSVNMRGTIDSSTPAVFRQMMAAYPHIQTIEMIDCPGSVDDDANLALSRMVRRAGINTHVPANGSIRSGGVEFFLAGVKRSIEPGAELGVHSWEDENGREATEYAANDPVHSAYINFYIEMGLNQASARAFYDFTNKAAPASGVYYMKPKELAQFQLLN
jgi:hypothetical protein